MLFRSSVSWGIVIVIVKPGLPDSHTFGVGREPHKVLDLIGSLGEEEWKADRLARKLSVDIYKLEQELDPLTIMFYDKIFLALGAIANEAENAGDMLRLMIVKS